MQAYREDVGRLERMERQREVARDEMLVMKYHTEKKSGGDPGAQTKEECNSCQRHPAKGIV